MNIKNVQEDMSGNNHEILHINGSITGVRVNDTNYRVRS